MEYSNFLHQNLSFLRDNTFTTNILEDCVKEKILSEEDGNLINDEKNDQAYLFWTKIITLDKEKLPSYYMTKLVDIFHSKDQKEVAKLLLKATRSNEIDQKFAFVNNVLPLKVIVREPDIKREYPDDVYVLPKVFMGLALIINISVYNTCGWKRHNAKQDTRYLEELWSKMGYVVRKKEGQFDRDTLDAAVQEFLSHVGLNKRQNCKSYIVYIGGRGNQESIILSNQDVISYKDFISMFSQLSIDKPKLFLIQTIPGRSPKLSQKLDTTLNNLIRNAFICFIREPWDENESTINVGSWVLHNFVDVFMREAFENDLETMLNNVNQNINLSVGEEDQYLFSFVHFGTRKVFFDLSRPGENLYSIYISYYSESLSKICEKEGCIKKIIEKCKEEKVLTFQDQQKLISQSGSNEDNLSTRFWKFIIGLNINLNELIDIFYKQETFDVVNILHGAIRDDGLDHRCMATKNWQPLKVKVHKPETPVAPYDIKKKDFYRLEEDFIGLALVINIIEYEKCGLRRHGAENDGTYMTELWSQMGYKVVKYEGYINKTKFEKILKKFIDLVKKLDGLDTKVNLCQSIVVYIGCHGSEGLLDLSEGQAKFNEDFIFKFTELPLPIPKIFVIQCCRIYVKEELENVELDIKTTENTTLESMKPIIICYSSVSGEKSNRDVFLGSLYTYVFCEVFMKSAHMMELTDLLTRVARTLNDLFKDTKIKQNCEYKKYGMENLYFNIQA